MSDIWRDGLSPLAFGEALADLEGIETDLAHELQLVGKHIAGRPQLAAIAVSPELARDRIGAPVGEGGEGQDDEAEARQDRG